MSHSTDVEIIESTDDAYDDELMVKMVKKFSSFHHVENHGYLIPSYNDSVFSKCEIQLAKDASYIITDIAHAINPQLTTQNIAACNFFAHHKNRVAIFKMVDKLLCTFDDCIMFRLYGCAWLINNHREICNEIIKKYGKNAVYSAKIELSANGQFNIPVLCSDAYHVTFINLNGDAITLEEVLYNKITPMTKTFSLSESGITNGMFWRKMLHDYMSQKGYEFIEQSDKLINGVTDTEIPVRDIEGLEKFLIVSGEIDLHFKDCTGIIEIMQAHGHTISNIKTLDLSRPYVKNSNIKNWTIESLCGLPEDFKGANLNAASKDIVIDWLPANINKLEICTSQTDGFRLFDRMFDQFMTNVCSITLIFDTLDDIDIFSFLKFIKLCETVHVDTKSPLRDIEKLIWIDNFSDITDNNLIKTIFWYISVWFFKTGTKYRYRVIGHDLCRCYSEVSRKDMMTMTQHITDVMNE